MNLFQPAPSYILYKTVWQCFNWLYPPQCAGCGRPYTRFCRNCFEMLRPVEEPICEICGKNIGSSGICPECSQKSPAYRALRSCAKYEGPLRNALHKLKYRGDISLGEKLAQPMIERLKKLQWDIDIVVPVPGSLARQKTRGYNQASLLALPIALYLRKPYLPRALRKKRDIPSQVGLSVSMRWKNVHDAYWARSELIAKKSVLIVDDIRTSGATMGACAKTIIDQGAHEVYGLTLAQAILMVP